MRGFLIFFEEFFYIFFILGNFIPTGRKGFFHCLLLSCGNK